MVSSETTDQPAWNRDLLRDPHAVTDKRTRVRRMFAAIAPSYDLNNRLHSLWMDQSWRRRAVKLASLGAPDRIVDVACGTGDLTVCFARALAAMNNGKLPPDRVLGIDFTYEMLPIAGRKSQLEFNINPSDTAIDLASDSREEAIRDRSGSGVIRYVNGDALSLPLPDACADVVSIAFGIRNVSDPAATLREFRRILRPGGRVIVLEFSLPTSPPLRVLYNFYFRKILPRTATLISGDKTGAYKYLPESVNTFIGRESMMQMMADAGFTQVIQRPMTFGVCVGYRGVVRT